MGRGALFAPVNILASTIIGAGMFALPYLFDRAGVLVGTTYLALFGGVFYLVHLMYADLLRGENGELIFPGLARKHLGKFGEYVAYVSGVFALLLTLTAYIVLEMKFFHIIFPSAPQLPAFLFFWGTGTLSVMLWRTAKLGPLEAVTNVATVLIIGSLIAFSFIDGASTASLSLVSFKNALLPYGAILFALSGRAAIPAVLSYLRDATAQRIALAIMLGTAIPIAVYLLFVYGVLAASPAPTEDAITGMVGALPPLIVNFFGALGIISLWSSYIIIGKAVRDSFRRDAHASYTASHAIMAIVPVALYFAGFRNFLQTINIIGGVFLAVESILIVLMWQKASKNPSPHRLIARLHPVVPVLLFAVFLGGIAHVLLAE